VLANLVNNAVDAGQGLPVERRRIRIDALRELDDVVIRVSDCGAGMSGETRARLFEAFYTTKPPGLGTGLGLAIARDIVCGEFGGSLELAASDGHGTTFVLRLPAAVAARRAAA